MFNKIKVALETAEAEDVKNENGNKAAGTRARNALMEVIKACKVQREKILERQK